MKKKTRKLELNRETLNAMEAQALRQAAGGVTYWQTCVWETGTRCNASICICD